MQRENDMIDDGSTLGPIEVYNVLERIMYNRRYRSTQYRARFFNRYLNLFFRSKNNPYWNTLVISGYDVNADEPFLGQIDSQVSHSSTRVLNNPIFRAHHSKQNLSVLVSVDF